MLITTTRNDHLCGMKKISVLCILIFTLIFPAGGCFDLKDAYTLADATTVDDISYCIKKDNDSESVVICSWWDGEATEIVYEIPDTFEGRDVVWLGDKASGFDIRQPSEYVFYDPDDGMIHQRYEDEPIADVSDESLEITDINVTFVLGENIEYIGTVGPSYLATGDKEDLSVYRVNLFFEISDDNPVYYSRDGVPYLRRNDEPVCTAATDLPDDSMSYELSYNEDTGATTFELNGRTYSLFGELNGDMNDDYIMECLGFVGGDENTRIYSLTDDESLNYLMFLKTDGSDTSPDFYRAMDTWQEDILTPDYIEPLGIESWGSAGPIHYEE